MGSSGSKGVSILSGNNIDSNPHNNPFIDQHGIIDEVDEEAKDKRRVRFDDDAIAFFEPTYEAATPRFNGNRNLKYIDPSKRNPDMFMAAAPLKMESTINQLNGEDYLARVALTMHQHVARGENAKQFRLRRELDSDFYNLEDPMSSSNYGNRLSSDIASEKFNQKYFLTPQIKYTWIRSPHGIPFMTHIAQEVEQVSTGLPDVEVIHSFMLKLFREAELSSECSLVSLVYVERLMEISELRLDAGNWRPIILASMLTASKVWQDLASWNIEFSQVYPEFQLKSINQLETMFLTELKWKTVIDQGMYTKYYFALRGKTDNTNFRQRYNAIYLIPENATRLETRSKKVQTLLLSKSL